MAKIMARLGIAAGLRLWLGCSGPVEDALYASAGSQAKSNLRSPRRHYGRCDRDCHVVIQR